MRTVCPQTYDGIEMIVTPCTRCEHWTRGRCVVPTGAEHLPLVPPEEVPPCPLEAACQHQRQSDPGPCPVRARGMVCESALREGGLTEAEAAAHPLSFHAMMM